MSKINDGSTVNNNDILLPTLAPTPTQKSLRQFMGKGMKKIVTQVTDNVEPIPEVELIPEVEKKVEFDLEN